MSEDFVSYMSEKGRQARLGRLKDKKKKKLIVTVEFSTCQSLTEVIRKIKGVCYSCRGKNPCVQCYNDKNVKDKRKMYGITIEKL